MGNRSRSKTTNYNEAAYYRSALGISAKPSKPKKARPPKQLRAQPFQFFPPRLYDLLEKETAKWSEMKEAGETPPLNADGQGAVPSRTSVCYLGDRSLSQCCRRE